MRWRPSAMESSLSGGLTPRAFPSTRTSPQGLIDNRTLPVLGTIGNDSAAFGSASGTVPTDVAPRWVAACAVGGPADGAETVGVVDAGAAGVDATAAGAVAP